VFTAGKQRGEDTQIRIAEQPAFRLPPDGSGRAHKRTEMFAAGDGAKMLGADSRQVGNLVFGENFLSGFYGDHSLPSSSSTETIQVRQKWNLRYENTYFPSNSPAVYLIRCSVATRNLQTSRIKSVSGIEQDWKLHWGTARGIPT